MKLGSRWSTKCGTYSLVIKSSPWKYIERECLRASNTETGGIIVGYYTDDQKTAVVTEAWPPPSDSIRSQTWFQRGIVGLKSMLARLWVHKNRRYYLGEWHYHPALHTQPSGHDIAQMVYISQAPNYQCQEPIMLVIGKQIKGIRNIRAFVFPRGNEFKEFFETQNLGNSN